MNGGQLGLALFKARDGIGFALRGALSVVFGAGNLLIQILDPIRQLAILFARNLQPLLLRVQLFRVVRKVLFDAPISAIQRVYLHHQETGGNDRSASQKQRDRGVSARLTIGLVRLVQDTPPYHLIVRPPRTGRTRQPRDFS